MNSVVSPLRMNMTTSTGHRETALSTSGRRYHYNRHSGRAMALHDSKCANLPAGTQWQPELLGYTGGYPHSLQGLFKPGQHRVGSSCRSKTEGRRTLPLTRRLGTATHGMGGPEREVALYDEDLAGRPAMIALSEEEMPRQDWPRGERLETRRSRGTSPSRYFSGQQSGTEYGTCRSRQSMQHATSGTDNQADHETSNQASGRIEKQARKEVVAWRVALDPVSKKPYYYHPLTRETTWKKPPELVAAETRETRQFFSVMEQNIRLKCRDGYYTRESDPSVVSPRALEHGQHTQWHDKSPRSSMRSSGSTVSCNSARSSVTSVASGSNRSLPGSLRQLFYREMQSLPMAPEGMHGFGLQLDALQPQLEPESDGNEKRPSLFRTLSSYETPVVTLSRKESDGVQHEAMASPLQERVRLAALVTQPSELTAYARAVRAAHGNGRPSLDGLMTWKSSFALKSAPETRTKAGQANTRLLRRANSTNSIYLRMGTMNAPDQDATIQCIATVLRAHMIKALDDPIQSDACFDVFVTPRDRQGFDVLDADATIVVETDDEAVLLDGVPTLLDIATFMKMVLTRAQMESECIIMSLVYVERLLKTTSGFLQLRGENWRRLVFCSMVMASKVWDDLSMTNADFSKIWPELSLKQINELELVYLRAVEYNVRVSAVSYAKYYFHLRSMCALLGLVAAFDESAPLNLDGARKMQVLSEEYQERSKLLPHPRRRSVTMTSVSSERVVTEGRTDQSLGRVPTRSAKASPPASLEHLVHMQVRVAGGSARSSLCRLSSTRALKP